MRRLSRWALSGIMSKTDDNHEARLLTEFQEESQDTCNEIDVMIGNLRSKSIDADEALSAMRRHFHNLRLGARAVGLPAVDVIAHQLVDYCSQITVLDDRRLDDLQAFTDKLRGALDGEVSITEIREVVRKLPTHSNFDVNDIQLLDIVVLLVSPQRATALLVERELKACGYRVMHASKSFEAIELSVRIKPDLIISAAVLDELTGIDLACALNAMPTTQGMPFALLTSFGWGDSSLDGLPPRAAIIRKGSHFGDDLAEALSRFQIT